MSRLKTAFRQSSRLAVAVALGFPGLALAGEISGSVSDSTATRALQGAELRIVELKRVAEAGRDGSFRFPDVPAGTYTLEARYVGTASARMKVDVAETGITTANVVLGSASDIIVVGQVANLSSSLSRQRAADGVESVVTRDSIGQFPDQNVAESLRRLPGVNILNDQGEGRFVSVRGLDPELNSASINGTRVPAPESDVRSVALDVIPAELIESIEVKKTLTPDMDADMLGASIEINTVSVFDRKKDLFSIKLEGSYNDYANAVTPKGSFDFSKRITDNFGIAGGVSYYKRQFETDNIEATDWTVDNGVANAREVQYRDYDVERERLGATLNLDWRPSDTTKLYARGLYSQFSDQENRADVTFIMSGAPRSGTGNSAQFDSADGRIEVRRRMKDRFEKQKIKSLTVGGKTETGPWTFSYSGAWSEASELENGSIDPTRFRNRFTGSGASGLGVSFDYSNPRSPLFNITRNSALFNNPATYAFNELERTTRSDSKDREYTMRGDIAREFAASGGTFTVQVGAKGRWRKKSYDLTKDNYEPGSQRYTLADVLGGQSYRLGNLGPLPSSNGPTDYFYANPGAFKYVADSSAIDSSSSDYAIKEDIISGYVLGRWDSATLRVIGGVRMEHTSNDIRAFLTREEDPFNPTPIQVNRSYTDWLPSLMVRYEPVRNTVLRLGGYKSLVRPKLSNLAPRFLINADGEAEYGNAGLKPYRAWNIDASAEWYFAKDAALSAGLFWKSIKDFVVEQRDFDGGTAYGIEYTEALTFVNGQTAKVKGVELSYNQVFSFLPAPFDGLLVNANYTYTDAKGDIPSYNGNAAYIRQITLPSTSKNTFNIVLGYEKGPVSFRAAGTYRDKYLDELGSAADNDRYVEQQFQLDLSAKYRIAPQTRLFAEWVNVTNAPYFAYQNFAGSRRLLQYEQYNWTIKFGATTSF
ncbi:MAG TPA: TonB-dependent receptor [Sphingobium sp.]|uniref:TonB-dependent receptor n=1 Tax=Sphingobium sp. TaxID=1912891 RepID=UPI002ED260AD